MALGTLTVTGGGGSEALVAANVYRDNILIQVQSDHDVYLGFGEDAVTLQGVALLEPGAWAKVFGDKARQAINVISTGNAVIGYETGKDIVLGVGQFAGPWPAS